MLAGKKFGRSPVSRILSLLPLQDWTVISLTPRTGSPAEAGGDYYPGIGGRAVLPLFCLAPRGVFRAALVALGAVGSYPTISPLPVSRNARPLAQSWFQLHRRYAFCCTFRPVASRLPSPIFMRRAALWCPDFPQPALAHRQRPSGERRHEPACRMQSRQADSRPGEENQLRQPESATTTRMRGGLP